MQWGEGVVITPRDNTIQQGGHQQQAEVRANVRSSRVQAPEIAYRTVTSVHLLILDASVQLMGKFVKLATSQTILPDPEFARRKQSVNCKQNRMKNITFSQWQTLAMKLHDECLPSWMGQIVGSRRVCHVFADLQQHVTKASSTESSCSVA